MEKCRTYRAELVNFKLDRPENKPGNKRISSFKEIVC
jgi:hypothetical protein